jgi:hypothetical protein
MVPKGGGLLVDSIIVGDIFTGEKRIFRLSVSHCADMAPVKMNNGLAVVSGPVDVQS